MVAGQNSFLCNNFNFIPHMSNLMYKISNFSHFLKEFLIYQFEDAKETITKTHIVFRLADLRITFTSVEKLIV